MRSRRQTPLSAGAGDEATARQAPARRRTPAEQGARVVDRGVAATGARSRASGRTRRTPNWIASSRCCARAPTTISASKLLKRATATDSSASSLDVAAPLSARVGNAWAAGTLQVYHEHLFSEAMQVTLRTLLRPLRTRCAGAAAGAHVAHHAGESHGLGILMAEAMFSLARVRMHRARAADAAARHRRCRAAHKVDVVALSFSAAMPAQAVTNGLAELRSLLPPARGNLGRRQQSGRCAASSRTACQRRQGFTPIDETVAALAAGHRAIIESVRAVAEVTGFRVSKP